jgi:hypothetical protein
MSPIRSLEVSSLARDAAGKGTAGCLVALFLLLAGTFIGVRAVPVYYAASNLETDVKTEISRAGAHFYDDETIVKNVVKLAERNEIRLAPENVKVQHLAGQIQINVNYSVPVDFAVYEYTFNFDIKASSFVGTL